MEEADYVEVPEKLFKLISAELGDVFLGNG